MRGFTMMAIFALALALALALSANLMARPDHAGKPDHAGPAQKATGGIEVQATDDTAQVEFNAHEAKANRDAKGEFCWSLGDTDDPTRTICVDVMYVKVDGNEAWFAGPAVEDTDETLVGHWLFVKALDGGTPATNGDQIWWEWLGEDAEAEAEQKVEDMEEPANEREILSGNLVVHTRD